jgi:putative ATP-dependent endonuclease of OLD family
LPRRFVSTLPWNENITKLASGSARMLERDVDTDCVASRAWFTDNIEGHLLNCWKGDPEPSRQNAIKDFRHSCRMLLSSAEENELFFTARRIRGEIFFARHWLLVEGPCEYLLLHALGQAFEWPLDQHGIAVIDFQNNGNASIYPALADAFGIPWHMVTDGDDESKKFRAQILKRGFNESDLIGHFDTLQPPNELEDQLLVDGHEHLLRDLLAEIGCANARNCKIEEFRGKLSNSKTGYMSLLAPKVAADSALAKKMPTKFVELVLKLKDGTL